MSAFLVVLLTILLTSSVWAAQSQYQPQSCPSVASIQQTPFINAAKASDGNYVAFQVGTYSSSLIWAFSIFKIPASSAQEALNKAIAALNSLSYASGPTYYPEHSLWACIYNIDSGYQALAATPLHLNAVNLEPVLKTTEGLIPTHGLT